MGKYATNLKRSASSTLSVGAVNCPGSSMRRLKLYDIMLGSEGAPADVANDWQVQRCTTTGTSTSQTNIVSLDSADAAQVFVAGQNHTIDPTLTANAILLSIALNQKASFRWVANPGCEIIVPATANNGLAFRTPTAGSSVAVTATPHIEE